MLDQGISGEVLKIAIYVVKNPIIPRLSFTESCTGIDCYSPYAVMCTHRLLEYMYVYIR